jgi:hypothetical protein
MIVSKSLLHAVIGLITGMIASIPNGEACGPVISVYHAPTYVAPNYVAPIAVVPYAVPIYVPTYSVTYAPFIYSPQYTAPSINLQLYQPQAQVYDPCLPRQQIQAQCNVPKGYHLVQDMPTPNVNPNPNPQPGPVIGQGGVTLDADTQRFSLYLKNNCVICHAADTADKKAGGFAMTVADGRGGYTEVGIMSTVEKRVINDRISRSPDDPLHMPPVSAPQPTQTESDWVAKVYLKNFQPKPSTGK